MNYEQLLKVVEDRTDVIDREEAEQTLFAVLQALADRLVGGEADDLLAQLPEPLKSEIEVTTEADPMTRDEFVARVATDLQLPDEEARDRTRGVFGAIQEAVTPGEWDDVMSQLDRSYDELMR
jgi:uncharacterized protein (DUF2267 family)